MGFAKLLEGTSENSNFLEKSTAVCQNLQKELGSFIPAPPAMPAGKWYDMVIGIDLEIAPPFFPPIPLPHTGLMFDWLAVIASALGEVIGAVVDQFDPPAEGGGGGEGGEEPPISVAKAARMVGEFLKGMGPTVFVNNMTAANAGTPFIGLPLMLFHLPMANNKYEVEMFMGSSTVVVDGSPFSYQFLPTLCCNEVGIITPFRKMKKPAPHTSLSAPTGALTVIMPLGNPVLVGGAPIIDLFQLAVNLGLKALGKIFKKIGDKFQKYIDDVKNPKLKEILQNIKCKTFGEPVDVATGRVYHTNIDFELSGQIPIVWERTYYSDAEVPTPLGYNWHHSYNLGFWELENSLEIRLPDGRETQIPKINIGESFYDIIEKLTLFKDQEGYYIQDASELIYRYSKQAIRDGFFPIVSIETLNKAFANRFEYDSIGNLTKIIDTTGREIKIKNDTEGRITDISTESNGEIINLIRYCYDAVGNLIQVIDAEDHEKKLYYDEHLLTRLTMTNGLNFYWEYEGRGNEAKCVHTWGDGGLLEYWASYEKGMTIVTNSLRQTTTYFYDDNKLITKEINPQGGIQSYQYNENQDLVIEIDENGNVTKYSYDQRGNRSTIIDANGNATSFGYDDQNRLTFAASPAGASYLWQYDENGQLIARHDPTGSTQFEYENGLISKITDAKGNDSHLEYDQAHNLSKLTLPDGTASRWTYDDLGRLIKATDPAGNSTTYKYDRLGQVTDIHEPDGNHRQLVYDPMGNVIRAKDIHHDVNFTYYGLGKLKSRTEGGRTIHFDYDKEEQLHTIRNEKGEAYRFELDALGNVITETGFDDLVRKYHRDPAGRVLKVQRPTVDGVKRFTNYNYDSIGNVVAVEHHDKTWQNYDYDADGNLIIAENADSKVKLQRNSAGQVETEIQQFGDPIIDGKEYVISSEYDKFGDRIGIKSSLGADIRHERNNLGDVLNSRASVAPPSGAGGAVWSAVFERDILGLETHRQLMGDVNVSTKRDSLGRVVKHEVRSGANRTRSKSYQWQPNNRLKNIVDNIKSETKEFSYDSFGNLVSCKDGDNFDYFFRDEVGNIFKDKALKGRKYEKGGRIEESETHEFFYDDEGNLTSKRTKDWREHWHYEWNGDGSLKSVKRPDGELVSFKYDALGRRFEKKYREQVTNFVWDGNTPLHEWIETPERSLSEVEKTTWVFDADSFVPSAKLVGDKSYSIISDYLGTPCQAYSETGAKVWEYEQKSYGGVESLAGAINFIPFRYQGQYEDVETGLYYNRFRYYSPDEECYISQDPIGLGGGKLNLYAYVKNSNLSIDPFGLDELVYRLLDADGNTVYYGITERTALERGQEHINGNKSKGIEPKKFAKMEVIAEGLNHDQARTLEATLIRDHLEQAKINNTDPNKFKKGASIEQQLKDAGLLNKNRGRDIDVPGRKYKGNIPTLDKPREVTGLKHKH